MPIRKCLEDAVKGIPLLKGRNIDELLARRDELKKQNNLSDTEADRAIKHEIAKEIHRKLFDQLEELNRNVYGSKATPKTYTEPQIPDITKQPPKPPTAEIKDGGAPPEKPPQETTA